MVSWTGSQGGSIIRECEGGALGHAAERGEEEVPAGGGEEVLAGRGEVEV